MPKNPAVPIDEDALLSGTEGVELFAAVEGKTETQMALCASVNPDATPVHTPVAFMQYFQPITAAAANGGVVVTGALPLNATLVPSVVSPEAPPNTPLLLYCTCWFKPAAALVVFVAVWMFTP